MADLEASSALARRLSSAQYFAFVRRLVRAIDQCVIDADGIVGRHADDGVVAFFSPEPSDQNPRPRERVSRPHERSCESPIRSCEPRSDRHTEQESVRLSLSRCLR